MKTEACRAAYKFSKGPGVLVVLSLLKTRPMHGYQIARRLCRNRPGAPDILRMGEGTLYPLLHRLWRRGFVRGKWINSAGRRRRRHYVITPKGKKEQTVLRSNWMELTHAVGQIVDNTGDWTQ